GTIHLKKSMLTVSEVVQHAVDISLPLIQKRLHRLHLNVAPELPAVNGDLTRLAQALSNLLNNAAKYTAEGGEIWLDAWADGHEVVLRLRDSGPGFAPRLLPRVFDLFTQAQRNLDRSEGGLGVGLTLVKLLVELHGGSVEASNAGPDSPAGHGAQLIVR